MSQNSIRCAIPSSPPSPIVRSVQKIYIRCKKVWKYSYEDMFYTLLGQPVTSVAMSRFGQIKSGAHPALLGSSPFYRKIEGYTGSFLFIFFCISQTSLNKIFNQKHQSCVCLIFCVLLLHHNNESFQHI